MIRCTIELLPGGDETRARPVGLVEIGKIGKHRQLRRRLEEMPAISRRVAPGVACKGQLLDSDGGSAVDRAVAGEDDEAIVAVVHGHHRTRRGVYDLLYRALRACGLEERNPR